MTSLVTGASGHVGANLVRRLLKRGSKVRVIVHEDSRALAGLDVERVRADVRDARSVLRAVAGARVVYHLAARITLAPRCDDEALKVNVEGTRHVVAACLESGVRRLIHVSSVHALEQRPQGFSLDEHRPLALGARELPYDRSKALAEQVVFDGVARGLDAVIVNPCAVLGPHDYKPSRMGTVLLALARRRLPALVAGGYHWIDARDLTEALVEAEKRGRTGERYLVAGPWCSLEDLAALVSETTGMSAPRLAAPMWLARICAPPSAAIGRIAGHEPLFSPTSLRVLRVANPVVCCERARDELGLTTRPLAQTVRDTIEWYREQGELDREPRSE
ncbi:MAG: NAD-dependent epimerase/dehydratase family protein [Acidobacteriota bacterium]|nr:MAG: NAD-dependent epimerase/dehydratase family protein [Acidobacteriota bacterium]